MYSEELVRAVLREKFPGRDFPTVKGEIGGLFIEVPHTEETTNLYFYFPKAGRSNGKLHIPVTHYGND